MDGRGREGGGRRKAYIKSGVFWLVGWLGVGGLVEGGCGVTDFFLSLSFLSLGVVVVGGGGCSPSCLSLFSSVVGAVFSCYSFLLYYEEGMVRGGGWDRVRGMK